MKRSKSWVCAFGLVVATTTSFAASPNGAVCAGLYEGAGNAVRVQGFGDASEAKKVIGARAFKDKEKSK